MYTKTKIPVFIVLLLALVLAVHANAPPPYVTFTSQPTSVASSTDYYVAWRVNDTASDPVNMTVTFYVNGAAAQTNTYTNNVTNGSLTNTYNRTYAHSYYTCGDALYVNVSVVESSNSTQYNSSRTNTVSASQSANAILACDSFEGLSGLGSNVSGFMVNLTPGVIAIIFGLAVVGVVITLLVAVGANIKSRLSGGMMRRK